VTAAGSTPGGDVTTSSHHRDAAEQALVEAQHNPVMSVEQSFRVAEVHALLAIERQLSEILDTLHGSPKPIPAPKRRS
jgi:hypothetical protein